MAMHARKEMPASEPPQEETPATPAAKSPLKSVPTEAEPGQVYLPGVHAYRKPRKKKTMVELKEEHDAKQARIDAMAARVDESMAQEDEREAAAGVLAEKYGADKAVHEEGVKVAAEKRSLEGDDMARYRELQALDAEIGRLQSSYDAKMGQHGEVEKTDAKRGALKKRLERSSPEAMALKKALARRQELADALGTDRMAELADKADFEDMLAQQRQNVAKRDEEKMEVARQVIAQEGTPPPSTDLAKRAYGLMTDGKLRRDFDLKTLTELEGQRKNLMAEKARLGASRWSRLWNGSKIDDLDYQMAVVDGELKPFEDELLGANVAMMREQSGQRGAAEQGSARIIAENKAMEKAEDLKDYRAISAQGNAALKMLREGRLHPGFDVVTYDRMEAEVSRLQAEEASLDKGFWSRLRNGGRLGEIRRKVYDFNEKLAPMRSDLAADTIEKARDAEEARRTIDSLPGRTQAQAEEDFFRRGERMDKES